MSRKLRHLLSHLFGNLSWNPPSWFDRSTQSIRAHRFRSAGILLALLAVSTGGWCAWDWYWHRPKPVTTSVAVETIAVTPLAKELIPAPLVIKFGGSVARLDRIQRVSSQSAGRTAKPTPAPVTSGIRIEPAIEGTWRWKDDRQLTFEPRADWPADQTFHVTFERSLFPEHVLLDRYRVVAKTPAFVATMPKLEFYTDPNEPAVKQVVATFSFTHRVDAAELEKRLKVALIGNSQVFKNSAPRFTLTLGQHQRLVYLRTSALDLPDKEDFMRVTLERGLPTVQGGAVTTAEVEQKVRVPDVYSFFRIRSAKGTIVRNNDGEPEQVLLIEGDGRSKIGGYPESAATSTCCRRSPRTKDGKWREPKWKSPDEIDEACCKTRRSLPVKLIPSGQENSTLHSFKISLETERPALS